MKLLPWILGAAVAVPVAGAFAGSNIGTDPIGSRDDVTSHLPRQSFGSDRIAQRLGSRQGGSDHYALETPDGRVEVYELAMRGRYADRFQEIDTGYDYEADIAYMETDYDLDGSASRAASVLDARQPRPKGAADETASYVEPTRASRYASAGTDATVGAVTPPAGTPAPLDTTKPASLAAVQVYRAPTLEPQTRKIDLRSDVAGRR